MGDLTIDTAAVGGGPNDIRLEPSAVVTWTTGYSLTLRAQNDVVISGTIQHNGPANGAGGLRLIADADKNGKGTVMVGTGNQASGVSAGSRYGLTRVEGASSSPEARSPSPAHPRPAAANCASMLPREDSQEIPTTASFNGESFAVANTIPTASLRGFYLFGDGPYTPKYSFYLGGQPDAGIDKTVAPTGLLRLGDPLTYTLSFSNSGTMTATGVVISDTLPAALTGASVSTALDAGVTVIQTSGAPDLAWQVSDLGVGKGGVITIKTALKNDVGLLGTSFKNTAIITATGDITLTNNAASVTSNVIAPATIVITKVVVGPPASGRWAFTGSGGIGSFSLPGAGGSTTLTPLLPDVAYTIEETVRAAYAPSVTCTNGSSGKSKVTVTPGAGKTIGCTFTNTYAPPAEYVYLPVVFKQ